MWPFGNAGNSKEEASPATETTKDETLTPTEEQIVSTDVAGILDTADFDPSKLHPLAGLDKDIEYLDLDDERLNSMEGSDNGILPSRGWGDDMCYGTGTCYVLGLTMGGLKGMNEGIKHLPQPKGPDYKPIKFKLKLNTVLNQVTKYGPHMGNNSGVLAIMYNIFDSSLDNFRGVHDDYNSLAAGFLSGALFKSTAGLKSMGISAATMTVAAGCWCGFKRYVAKQPDAPFK